jgi:PAS domain S-box-containing protein
MADVALPGRFSRIPIPVDKAEASGSLDANLIIANAPDPTFVSDLEGTILHANEAARQLLGLCPGESLGQSLAHHMSDEDARACSAALREVVSSGGARSLEVQPRSAAGEVIPVALRVSALRDQDGSVVGALGSARDLCAYERVAHDLEQTRADLQAAHAQQMALEEQVAHAQERTNALLETMRAKDEFLSIASHELKTPLTTMKLLIQLAQRELARANAPKITHIDRMGRSIVRMEQLINDLLDVSRIDSGTLVMRPEPCDVAALCQQIAEEQAAANSREITFVAQGTPTEMLVDGERVGQVVTNLLANAIKYSPAAEPVALAFVQQEEAGIICVRDKGPGIPEEALPHIFERFYRVPGIEAQNGSGRGLGLGLHLCQEIVERHGGQIWAESTVGSGTNFYVALPVAGPLSSEASDPANETIGSEVYQPVFQRRAER